MTTEFLIPILKLQLKKCKIRMQNTIVVILPVVCACTRQNGVNVLQHTIHGFGHKMTHVYYMVLDGWFWNFWLCSIIIIVLTNEIARILCLFGYVTLLSGCVEEFFERCLVTCTSLVTRGHSTWHTRPMNATEERGFQKTKWMMNTSSATWS